ncbi:MAG: ABC transporter substrate-binding protein [Ignavibacteriaceae bacterium]|nr:ABC transporter substrate-binding protein [Ignavibacteriaceae bacterium]
MKINRLILSLPLIIILVFLSGCQKGSSEKSGRIIAAITSDVESLNPLFAFSDNEGNISELLYASLVQHEWNYKKGDMDTFPMLAKSWEWNGDSSSITLYLRDDVKWSDGQQFTANDVVFSFDVYSDPIVQSKLYGSFRNFFTDTAMHIDLKKTFVAKSSFVLTINFKKNPSPTFYDIDFPIIPEHVYKNINRKDLITAEKEIKPVTDGAFSLSQWNKNQSLILKADKKSFLYKGGNVSELVFKIVPDYNSGITQLKKGEIDLMEDIKADDYPVISNDGSLGIAAVKGREYDYAGWNNLDPDIYKKTKHVVPNKLFGNADVRKALTLAINRDEILKQFLNNHGEVAFGPVSSIFKDAFNYELHPLPYLPDSAKKLLALAGWKDTDRNGTLKKNGQEFSFTLSIPGGNPRREFTATVIQNNLQALGIKIKIEKLEPDVFFQKMFNRELEAWVAGWTVPIPLDLKSFWYSNLTDAQFNVAGYQNKAMDELLKKIEVSPNSNVKNNLYKKLQEIIYSENPVTFLFWDDKLIAYNKRIQNLSVSPLGVFQRCWNWSTK